MRRAGEQQPCVQRENQARWDDDGAAANRPLIDAECISATNASVERRNKSAMKYKS